MNALEDESEVMLFLRDRNHIELTPAGEIFLKRVSAILVDVNQALKEVRDLKEETSGFLALAVNDTMGAVYLPEIVHLLLDMSLDLCSLSASSSFCIIIGIC